MHRRVTTRWPRREKNAVCWKLKISGSVSKTPVCSSHKVHATVNIWGKRNIVKGQNEQHCNMNTYWKTGKLRFSEGFPIRGVDFSILCISQKNKHILIRSTTEYSNPQSTNDNHYHCPQFHCRHCCQCSSVSLRLLLLLPPPPALAPALSIPHYVSITGKGSGGRWMCFNYWGRWRRYCKVNVTTPKMQPSEIWDDVDVDNSANIDQSPNFFSKFVIKIAMYQSAVWTHNLLLAG